MLATLVHGPDLDAMAPPFRADDADHRLGALWRYWNACRGRRTMPGRKDLDPVDIPRLLANLILVDVGAEPDDLRYRLAGTEVVRLFGIELTGRTVGTGMPAIAARLTRARFAHVVRTARPAFAAGMMEADRNHHTP
jgi:hypothetical protein